MSFISVLAKINFKQPILQSSVSYNPFKNHFNMPIECTRNISYSYYSYSYINVENSCAAQYFLQKLRYIFFQDFLLFIVSFDLFNAFKLNPTEP